MTNLPQLIQSLGYLGVWGIIFAESGLFVGFFLPGDSLLFTAGFLSSQQLLNLWMLLPGAVFFAVLGDTVGYRTGRWLGRRLYQRPDSRWFRKQHLLKAQAFYDRHGGKAIVLARFMPIVRTFAPIAAGAAPMRYRHFAVYNILGALLWTGGLLLAGYFLGKLIPDVDHYLMPIIALIIILSLTPSLWHLYQNRAHKH